MYNKVFFLLAVFRKLRINIIQTSFIFMYCKYNNRILLKPNTL